MKDEKKLVLQILKGNEQTLRQFYNFYHPRLLTFIKNKINNQSDAEEILQDTLLATLEALRDFSFRSSLFTFICSIAYHKIVDFYRKKRIKSIFFSQMPEFEPLISTLLGPEEALDEGLLKERVKEVFKRIAPCYTKILKLKYIYGYSVAEIAYKLSITFKSAESRLFRARKAFVVAYSI